MFRTKFYQMVELIVPATVTAANQDVYFQMQPQLQTLLNDKNIWVKGLATYSDQALAFSPQTTGNPVATAADIQNATISLNIHGRENFRQMPLADLNKIWDMTGGTPFTWQMLLLKNLRFIDWTKSKITVVAPPVAPPFSYLFGVHYDYRPDGDFDPNFDE